jgi:hypothetical protein
MKLSLAGVVVLVVIAWLAMWATNTGVLVFSAASKIPKTRECHYFFIGVSVLKRIEPLL